MSRLILLNGAPGIGKSTVAQRYVAAAPMTLCVEIDAIRTSLGRWRELEESKVAARDLALAMAEAHLRDAHDVVLPQFLGRPEFIERLRAVSTTAGADFIEVLLVDDDASTVERFAARRRQLEHTGDPHPESDVSQDGVNAFVAEARSRLEAMYADRADVHVITVSDGPDVAADALRALLSR